MIQLLHERVEIVSIPGSFRKDEIKLANTTYYAARQYSLTLLLFGNIAAPSTTEYNKWLVGIRSSIGQNIHFDYSNL